MDARSGEIETVPAGFRIDGARRQPVALEPSLEVDDVPWNEFVESHCFQDGKHMDADVRLTIAPPLGGHHAPRAAGPAHSRKKPRAVTNRTARGMASR